MSSIKMRQRGLKPAAQLAENKPHGNRLRYIGGCRCIECKSSNTAYEAARKAARSAGDWNGNVSAEKARQHLITLSQQQIGRRTIADASGVASSALSEIIAGRKTHIRALTERRILAVTTIVAADHALIDAALTWEKLNTLLGQGYTKAELAGELGMKTRSLQVGKNCVTVRKAYEIDRMYQRLKSIDATYSATIIAEFEKEGYLQSTIEHRLKDMAAKCGINLSWPLIRKGHIKASHAELLCTLYDDLVGGGIKDSGNDIDAKLEISPEILQLGLTNGKYRFVAGALQKRCIRCKDYWPADREFFYSSRGTHCKDGLNDYCKACYASTRNKQRT